MKHINKMYTLCVFSRCLNEQYLHLVNAFILFTHDADKNSLWVYVFYIIPRLSSKKKV